METIIEKTQQELPLKNRLFNTKEEYLAMRQAWKDFHNNGHAKAEWVETTHKVWQWHSKSYIEFLNKTKVSPLDGDHYMLYNLLRGLPKHRGFLSDDKESTIGYEDAIQVLRRYIPIALDKDVKIPPFVQHRGEEAIEKYRQQHEERRLEFLHMLTKPFGNTVTEEHLKLVLEEINR
jgi:hypothetical protein